MIPGTSGEGTSSTNQRTEAAGFPLFLHSTSQASPQRLSRHLDVEPLVGNAKKTVNLSRTFSGTSRARTKKKQKTPSEFHYGQGRLAEKSITQKDLQFHDFVTPRGGSSCVPVLGKIVDAEVQSIKTEIFVSNMVPRTLAIPHCPSQVLFSKHPPDFPSTFPNTPAPAVSPSSAFPPA